VRVEDWDHAFTMLLKLNVLQHRQHLQLIDQQK
jgi:hypothetical protein